MQMTNWKNWAIGGVAALTIMTGGLYVADDVSAAAPVAEEIVSADVSTPARINSETDQMRRGPRDMGPGERAGVDGDALLAEALGITVEELDAAREVARTKAADEALAQAVTDGKLTQAQANALKELQSLGNGRLMARLPMVGNYDTHLAEALGVTEEQLEAARDAAHQAGIEQAVADGTITQEQADEMLTRLALKDYVQAEMETAFETAIQNAVADGVITQEQADEILSQEQNRFGRGMRGGLLEWQDGMRRPGGFDGGMRDGRPGMRGGAMDDGFGPKSQSNQSLEMEPGSQL